MQSMCLFLLL